MSTHITVPDVYREYESYNNAHNCRQFLTEYCLPFKVERYIKPPRKLRRIIPEMKIKSTVVTSYYYFYKLYSYLEGKKIDFKTSTMVDPDKILISTAPIKGTNSDYSRQCLIIPGTKTRSRRTSKVPTIKCSPFYLIARETMMKQSVKIQI